jgi:hypothetical protein
MIKLTLIRWWLAWAMFGISAAFGRLARRIAPQP